MSEQDIITRAVQLGDFGPGKRTWKYSKNRKAAHFASRVEFIIVTVTHSTVDTGFSSSNNQFATSHDNDVTNYPVVVKMPPSEEFMRELMHSDEQFETEVRMYSSIVRYLGLADAYPKMYFGEAKNPDTDCVVLEDWTPRGYKMSESPVFLDLAHVIASVREIARFHAASFTAKLKSKEKFFEITKGLRFTPFGEGDGGIKKGILLSQDRGMKPLNHELADRTLESLKKPDFMEKIMKPCEPWTVLIHGDCYRNNMLFRYEETISCVLIDFQLCRLSSPVIDLSYFLYLNTSSSLRASHWETILQAYWDALSSICPAVPDFSSFINEFSQRAVFGYFLCSYFLPVLMYPTKPDLSNDNKTDEDIAEGFANHGGKEATSAVIDIARHLLEEGYLKAFLDFKFS